jgi:hypothetical protein
MHYEFPLKKEVKASLHSVEILICSEMEPVIREALVSILSRCENILLLETHGSTYATT